MFLGIAGLVKGGSDKHDCKAHSGFIDEANWKVYATGKNCDTSAELETIQGAIAEYLRSVDDEICGVQCLKMTAGGKQFLFRWATGPLIFVMEY